MSDSQDEKLKTTYDQLCYSYRAIDDFRAKLLGFLPLASGTGIFLLIPKEGGGPDTSYLLPVGAFGFLVTLGLFFYELYGIKKCHNLIRAGQQIEGQMGIRGQFKERPREVARFINEPFAAGVIYPAVLAGWMFLALQGQEIFKRQAFELVAVLLISSGVFVVGLGILVAYNRRLGTEKTFLAKLLDHEAKKLDESFFGSHTLEGAHESARDWAKTVKDAACIQLTDADDVKESKTFKVGAPYLEDECAMEKQKNPDDRGYRVESAARYLSTTNEAVDQLVEEGLIKRDEDRPELLAAGSVRRWKDLEEARRYIGADDKKKEAARLDYEQTLTTYRMLADIRFKLLAFIPVVSGIAITLLSRYVTKLEPQITLVIGVLGFVVTLGIVIYDQRNSQIHDETVGRARFLEDVLKFPSRKGRSGHMSQRPDENRRLFNLMDMWHDRGLALIYGAVLGAWIFPIAYAVLDLWEDLPITVLGLSKYSAAGLLAALTAAVFFIEFQRLERR